MAERERADVLLVLRGLVQSRQKAQALIMAGQVFSGERKVDKAGDRLLLDAPLRVKTPMAYVSRGGLKLEAALDHFGVEPAGKSCIDVGASTGGFTDCLLQRNAVKVHAIDVGYGQLAWKVRNDPRVTVVERTNFRTVPDDFFDEMFDLAVVDVSFISLGLILPSLKRFIRDDAEAVVLVKPQFEAGPEKVGKGGIVREESVRQEALARVLRTASEEGFMVLETMECPVPGADGNIEFFAYLKWKSEH